MTGIGYFSQWWQAAMSSTKREWRRRGDRWARDGKEDENFTFKIAKEKEDSVESREKFRV